MRQLLFVKLTMPSKVGISRLSLGFWPNKRESRCLLFSQCRDLRVIQKWTGEGVGGGGRRG